MTPFPEFVLFDLGNVLIRIAPEAFLQELGLDSPDNRRFYQAQVTEIVRRYEGGTDSTEAFLANLDRLFNGVDINPAGNPRAGSFSREDLRRAMLAIMKTPVPGMLELVKSLSGVIPLGLLSNTNPLHYELCREEYPELRLIQQHFLSYHLQALKPHRLIFEKVISQLPVAPARVLYVDDLPENVDAGKAAGFRAHLFRSSEGLKTELERLLPPGPPNSLR